MRTRAQRRAGRGRTWLRWLWLGIAALLCATLFACSALLGFDDLTSENYGSRARGDSGAQAEGGAADAATDASQESSAKDITAFAILGVNATISGSNIALTLPSGTTVTSLTPTITITGVTISPANGMPQNFSGPVTYTVTAADRTIKAYTVTVSVAPSSANDITQFTILGIDAAISATSIALTLPSGTDVTALIPTITIAGASVSPASGAARNFSTPVTYTVTAADATTKVYTVTVSVAAINAKDITQFTILGVNGTIAGTSIALTLPFGTNLSSLTPTVSITGASIVPTSGAARNFSAPVTYTVTAADKSTKAYTVTVSAAMNGAKDITQLTILGVNGTIAGTSIALTVPAGTNLSSLTPTVAIAGSSVSPASGVSQDFTAPVIYTVTAADLSTKAYTVTVSVAPASGKDITQFTILGVAATINGTNVAITLPSGTSVASLTPTIVITGASVSPASGVGRNFAGPLTYTVTAADLSTKAYTVTVSVAPGSVKDITQFTILGVSGTITGTNIAITLPSGTSVTSLTPAIAITGASVSPANGVGQNFTAPVTYTVTAADLSTKAYTVTVSVAPSSVKDITQFTILGVNGAITGTNIALALPSGTIVTNLTPAIAITGASVSPANGVGQNFTNPVTYTVTAGDLSTKAYTVTVTVAAGCGGSCTLSQVDCGAEHTCSLSGSTIVCWGSNSAGQSAPQAGPFSQLSTGGFHTCGLKSDNSISCWGYNNDGECTVPPGSFTQLSAGWYRTCAIKTDNTVACWGNNYQGASTAPGGQFSQVSAGGFNACGIKADNTVTCWGDDYEGQSTTPPGSYSQVSAGFYHSCAVRTDNAVVCWGNNTYGQKTVPPGSFTEVSAGPDQTCARKTDGSIACWGRNQLGQATPPTSGSYSHVSTGDGYSCALRTDGVAVCWGSNSSGKSTPP